MELLGHEFESWVIALVLACLMVAAWTIGWRRGVHRAVAGLVHSATINDAILALFGLLLGFTFSMSLSKHEQRRLMLINDSNAIGDFSTCVSLLKDQHLRSEMLATLKTYLQSQLQPLINTTDNAVVARRLNELQALQSKLQDMVGLAIATNPSITVPLVNTFNDLTSSHASRLSSLRDRLPGNIVLLLSFAAMIAMALQGQRQGEAGNNLFTPSLGFILLASMVIWVTLDLNEPNRGWITVSKEPMERVLAGLNK